jgi:hypothetical protein
MMWMEMGDTTCWTDVSVTYPSVTWLIHNILIFFYFLALVQTIDLLVSQLKSKFAPDPKHHTK